LLTTKQFTEKHSESDWGCFWVDSDFSLHFRFDLIESFVLRLFQRSKIFVLISLCLPPPPAPPSLPSLRVNTLSCCSSETSFYSSSIRSSLTAPKRIIFFQFFRVFDRETIFYRTPIRVTKPGAVLFSRSDPFLCVSVNPSSETTGNKFFL